jgi:hypothetical protein
MQASTTNIMSISDRTFIINTLLSNITFTKTGLQLLEAQDEGERENMTKGNGEQMGNSKESLGKHREQDRRGSGKMAEGVKVKRFTRLCGRERLF